MCVVVQMFTSHGSSRDNDPKNPNIRIFWGHYLGWTRNCLDIAFFDIALRQHTAIADENKI
jgi:hypothetical protein